MTKANGKGIARETTRETQIDKTNTIARQILQIEADRRSDLTAVLRAARLAKGSVTVVSETAEPEAQKKR